jgi:hypothetical protein
MSYPHLDTIGAELSPPMKWQLGAALRETTTPATFADRRD